MELKDCYVGQILGSERNSQYEWIISEINSDHLVISVIEGDMSYQNRSHVLEFTNLFYMFPSKKNKPLSIFEGDDFLL